MGSIHQSVLRSGHTVCSPRLYLWLVLPCLQGRSRLLAPQNGKHTRMLSWLILPHLLVLLLAKGGTLHRSNLTGLPNSKLLWQLELVVARDRSRLKDLLNGKHTRMLNLLSLLPLLAPPLSTMHRLLSTLLALPPGLLLSTLLSLH